MTKRAPSKKKKNNVVLNDQLEETNSVEKEYDGDDETRWLGYVCEKYIPAQSKYFGSSVMVVVVMLGTINVAQECFGFDAKAAEDLEKWYCWDCDPPVDGVKF